MEWYYAHDNRQIGPVSEIELQQLVNDGVVKPETLVWHSGLTDWQPHGTLGAVPPLPGSAEQQRHCSACGKPFPASELAIFGESAVCAWCKPAWVQRLRQGMTSTARPAFVYAGFWIRVLALVLDGTILSVIQYAILLPTMGLTYALSPSAAVRFSSAGLGFLYTIFFWIRFGATPGKMILKLKVVTPDGGSLTPGRAVGRYFAQILSALIIGIGFIMAGLDDEKRTLHDRIAGTRVIRTSE
jgi:uncharacterized RDD family membrane protein YckC